MALLDLFAYGPGWGDELVAGFIVTLQRSLSAYVIGTGLGLLAAIGELSRFRTLSAVLQGYALVVRSLPELLIIFLLYYGGAAVLHLLLSPLGIGRIDVSAFGAGLAALAFIHGAYASEVFRGAITAVPHGTIEAARSLGLRPLAVALTVTLPLAFRYALPGLVNLWMVLIKTTALVSAIGVEDFVRVSSTAGQNSKQYFVFFSAVLVAYLALSGVTMLLQGRLSRRLFRHLDGARA